MNRDGPGDFFRLRFVFFFPLAPAKNSDVCSSGYRRGIVVYKYYWPFLRSERIIEFDCNSVSYIFVFSLILFIFIEQFS